MGIIPQTNCIMHMVYTCMMVHQCMCSVCVHNYIYDGPECGQPGIYDCLQKKHTSYNIKSIPHNTTTKVLQCHCVVHYNNNSSAYRTGFELLILVLQLLVEMLPFLQGCSQDRGFERGCFVLLTPAQQCFSICGQLPSEVFNCLDCGVQGSWRFRERGIGCILVLRSVDIKYACKCKVCI